jgi:hypothetical protein
MKETKLPPCDDSSQEKNEPISGHNISGKNSFCREVSGLKLKVPVDLTMAMWLTTEAGEK